MSRPQLLCTTALLSFAFLGAQAGLAVYGQAHAEDAGAAIEVVLNQAKVMHISRPADIVIIGNPSIADATKSRIETPVRGSPFLVTWAPGVSFVTIDGLEAAFGTNFAFGGDEKASKDAHDIEVVRCLGHHCERAGERLGEDDKWRGSGKHAENEREKLVVIERLVSRIGNDNRMNLRRQLIEEGLE